MLGTLVILCAVATGVSAYMIVRKVVNLLA
jgi:hypothetical protein